MRTDDRIARWHKTLDHTALWPDTTPAERVSGYARILAAAERVLAGRPATLEAGAGTDARALGIAAFISGMGALLAWWIEQGVITASPEAAGALAPHLAHSRRRMVRVADRLREVVATLGRRGIVPAILKGSYTARRYFQDPAVRPASDADLLVAPGEFAGAQDGLRELGLHCHTHHTRPQREEWGPPDHQIVESVEMGHEANPWGIDLHQSLDRRYLPGVIAGLGSPGPEAFIPWASPFGPVRVLRQPMLAAHLALHAGCDLPEIQLMRIIELVNVLRQDVASGELHWHDLLDLLRRTQTRRFAYPALEMAALLTPGSVDAALREELAGETTARMRRAVAQCLSTLPFHFRSRSVELHLVWAKGPRQVARKLLDLAYPSAPGTTPGDRLTIWRR